MSARLPVSLDPSGVEPPEPDPGDPRLGRWLAGAEGLPPGTRVALVGFPSDEGVRRNGGRPGAAEGPDEARRALYAMTPDPRGRTADAMSELLEETWDLGDVPVSGDVEEDQARLADVLARLLERRVTPVVLGGGHETAYGHFLAYARSEPGVEILNVDAHPDVRPVTEAGAHSGSPFRQALEHPSGGCRGYTVAGLQPASVAREHLAYLGGRDATVAWRGETDADALRRLVDGLSGPAMASFDLDAVDRSRAPGVSAPATHGIPVEAWLAAAERAGRSRDVTSADVVELNPRFDRDGQTAALAAATVWRFLRGRARATLDGQSGSAT